MSLFVIQAELQRMIDVLQCKIEDTCLKQADLICPISLEILQTPVRINCAANHIFNSEEARQWLAAANKCPLCKGPASEGIPCGVEVGEKMALVKEGGRIPLVVEGSDLDEELAQMHLNIAQKSKEKGKDLDVISSLKMAFKYTNSSENYKIVPIFYKQLGQIDKAIWASLELAKYQLREEKLFDAIQTVEECSAFADVDLFLSSLYETSGDTSKAIGCILRAIKGSLGGSQHLEKKILLHERLLRLDPAQWDSYEKLSEMQAKDPFIPLLKGAEEALHREDIQKAVAFCFNAETKAAPQASLIAIWRKVAVKAPIYVIKLKALSAKLPEGVFGKEAYRKMFSIDVGDEPPLPENIEEILSAPCPESFGLEGTVRETHMLVLIPKEFTKDGEEDLFPFTLDALEELIKSKAGAPYRYYASLIKRVYGNQCIEKSRWVLVTKSTIKGSHGCSYEAQETLVKRVPGYSVPNILDAMTCILTGCLRGDGVDESIRCGEMVEGYASVVNPSSLSLSWVSSRDFWWIGVAALIKF